MTGQAGIAARCARRIALRTGAGPLRRLWLRAHWIVISAAAAVLRYRTPGAAVYARGSFGEAGHPVPGLSDIDLVLVVPDSSEPVGMARRRSVDRWTRLTRHVPWLHALISVGAYEDRELADATRATILTHGLDQKGAARAFFAGPDPLRDHLTARAKPGFPAPMSDWRRVAGPERRPVRRPHPDNVWIAAWLELQCWWRYAFWAAARPAEAHVAYLGVKLVAEPLRVLLWLRHGEYVPSRRAALKRGRLLVPEVEDGIRRAIRTWERIHRCPDAELSERIAVLLRLTDLVAREIARAAAGRGATGVSLVARDDDATPATLAARADLLDRVTGIEIEIVPVADWRARTVPGEPEEAMLAVSGANASDPAVLAAAGSVERPGMVVALPAGEVLVMPTLDRSTRPLLRGTLRAAQCRQSDPVSFSLLDGRGHALFPELPGWSARDAARRAAAEHSARLAEPGDGADLSGLLAAARAAMFLETQQEGTPRLAVDGAAVCSELARRGAAAATVAAAACEAWHAARTAGTEPDPRLIRELGDLVRTMPFTPAGA